MTYNQSLITPNMTMMSLIISLINTDDFNFKPSLISEQSRIFFIGRGRNISDLTKFDDKFANFLCNIIFNIK